MDLRWRLSHARGYLGLGMLAEAKAELDAIPAGEADGAEVRALRIALLHALADWAELARFAGRLVERWPEEPGWWVSLAFATRRTASIERAREILLRGEHRHPDDPTIQFNLGCYACRLGELGDARRHVLRAIALDEVFRVAARRDEDLERLRAAEPGLFG